MSETSLSQVPGCPSFRHSASNAIAVVPLLSTDQQTGTDLPSHSSRSMQVVMKALQRYGIDGDVSGSTGTRSTAASTDRLVVVPNSQLTRPGDWKYQDTPLKNFHWRHGCQRLQLFDGRPTHSRKAHDRLMNPQLTHDWIDLCPHRRTSVVIGILNVQDCVSSQNAEDGTVISSQSRVEQAIAEWKGWAERYSTPPYEVTAHGRNLEKDLVVQRLFVLDSFRDDNVIDMEAIGKLMGTSSQLVAFPPMPEEMNSEEQGQQQASKVLDLHMNVVVQDLAVAVFQELERRIKESDAVINKGGDASSGSQPLSSTAAKSRFFGGRNLVGGTGGSRTASGDDAEAPQGSGATLSLSHLATVVSPDSQLATVSPTHNSGVAAAAAPILARSSPAAAEMARKLADANTKGASSEAQLLTPIDDVWDFSELNPKDSQEMMRREVGRREKYAGDLALLAGSPLDAYERYMKAAELCKSTCPDPLWYASALEGCAAAHIAMAEAGGFSVDDYLETSFQLPDELMACAVQTDKSNNMKQTMSGIVALLCDDALNILGRHAKLAPLKAELLLKLAWYVAEVEDTHVRCQWGLGDGCYGGDPTESKRRWELSSATQFNFLELKDKRGDDVIARNTLSRCQKLSEYLHQAASTGALDAVTRADISLRCASLCLHGLRPTTKPTSVGRSEERTDFRRKAAFFVLAAAESTSEADEGKSSNKAAELWTKAAEMLSASGNGCVGGNYGWATLRAVALHGLTLQGLKDRSEEGAAQLLSLLSEIVPDKRSKQEGGLLFADQDDTDTTAAVDDTDEDSISMRSEVRATGGAVVSAARSYVKETRAKVAKARGQSFFSGQAANSTLLAVAQSKWVEDQLLPPILFPMADFSDISYSILALRAAWSVIKLENCFTAQKKIEKQITEIRRKATLTSVASSPSAQASSFLPIKIKSVSVGVPDANSVLERVKVKTTTESNDAMATFFNPYAEKKGEVESVIVPEGEERFCEIKFSNPLSIPVDVVRCQIEFVASVGRHVKAHPIAFSIPGLSTEYAVQFPFFVLDGSISTKFELTGLHVTCLSRSFFLPLTNSESGQSRMTGENPQSGCTIPDSVSRYPQRNYDKNANADALKSPVFEAVPSQPLLLVTFAKSTGPLPDDMIIPVPISDGEAFELPKLQLTNGSGHTSSGALEELIITSSGLPGRSKEILFDLSGTSSNDAKAINKKKGVEQTPLSLFLAHNGMDKNTLNSNASSSLSLKLVSVPDMGSHTQGCTIKINFRYRGKAPTSDVEIWRKKSIEVRVLRTKGPRISSLSFRPDLSWKSAYTPMCRALANETKETDTPAVMEVAGYNDDGAFILSRVGKDPSVNVCGEKVAIILTVANETTSAITLSRPDGQVFGFDDNPMGTIRMGPGVSARIPMTLCRSDRASGISQKLIEMTTMNWKSDVNDESTKSSMETTGTIVPLNRRVRQGTILLPPTCVRSIVDENPIFVSRFCLAPCSISTIVPGIDEHGTVKTIEGKPTEVRLDIDIAQWIPKEVMDQLSCSVQVFCARTGSDRGVEGMKDFVWSGQFRKTLNIGQDALHHNHRTRLVFLQQGTYSISACVTFQTTKDQTDDNTKEIWWAERAQTVRVQ